MTTEDVNKFNGELIEAAKNKLIQYLHETGRPNLHGLTFIFRDVCVKSIRCPIGCSDLGVKDVYFDGTDIKLTFEMNPFETYRWLDMYNSNKEFSENEVCMSPSFYVEALKNLIEYDEQRKRRKIEERYEEERFRKMRY